LRYLSILGELTVTSSECPDAGTRPWPGAAERPSASAGIKEVVRAAGRADVRSRSTTDSAAPSRTLVRGVTRLTGTGDGTKVALAVKHDETPQKPRNSPQLLALRGAIEVVDPSSLGVMALDCPATTM
jgi:hypothetical protein